MLATFLAALVLTTTGPDDFTTGPQITDFGPNALVDAEMVIPEGFIFRHSFDFAAEADAGELNRNLVSAARFLNMHVRAGVPVENLNLAIVVHGVGVHDVADATIYAGRHEGAANANAALIAQLVEHGVRIYVCGQSAAYYDVATANLLPGVEMALSAMTAHAVLQAEGYTLNPF
ncbi:DsrE family protein [Maricaulis sp. MIT060901]|uniref:DsrE family protein n=1 Tax=Maricaulis sp. MIT060901 TaxID=3096993 RepID=UPI003999E450